MWFWKFKVKNLWVSNKYKFNQSINQLNLNFFIKFLKKICKIYKELKMIDDTISYKIKENCINFYK